MFGIGEINVSLKNRLSRLERDNQPKQERTITLDWTEWNAVPETPEARAARIAARPTHNDAGERIIYIEWDDDDDIPGPDVDDETRLKWAEDVIAEDDGDDQP
jgi:hypothetical protein